MERLATKRGYPKNSQLILLNLLKSTNPFVFKELLLQLTRFPEKGIPSNISFKQTAVSVHIMKTTPPVKSIKRKMIPTKSAKHSPPLLSARY